MLGKRQLKRESPTLGYTIADEFNVWPPCRPPDDAPLRDDVRTALRAVENRSAVGPNDLSPILQNVLINEGDTNTLGDFYEVAVAVRTGAGTPQQLKNIMLDGPHTKNIGHAAVTIGLLYCSSLAVHIGEALHNAVEGRLSECSQRKTILARGAARWTTARRPLVTMALVVPNAYMTWPGRRTIPCTCAALASPQSYASDNQTILWTALTC